MGGTGRREARDENNIAEEDQQDDGDPQGIAGSEQQQDNNNSSSSSSSSTFYCTTTSGGSGKVASRTIHRNSVRTSLINSATECSQGETRVQRRVRSCVVVMSRV